MLGLTTHSLVTRNITRVPTALPQLAALISLNGWSVLAGKYIESSGMVLTDCYSLPHKLLPGIQPSNISIMVSLANITVNESFKNNDSLNIFRQDINPVFYTPIGLYPFG